MIKKYAKRGSSIFKFNYATKPVETDVQHLSSRADQGSDNRVHHLFFFPVRCLLFPNPLYNEDCE
ncbi:hypothetical protein VCRA2120O434_270001 [Vibrio crassostreae]|nr:hypothetical protein VCRA2120O434_270001 [Vibrio crassostreae]